MSDYFKCEDIPKYRGRIPASRGFLNLEKITPEVRVDNLIEEKIIKTALVEDRKYSKYYGKYQIQLNDGEFWASSYLFLICFYILISILISNACNLLMLFVTSQSYMSKLFK